MRLKLSEATPSAKTKPSPAGAAPASGEDVHPLLDMETLRSLEAALPAGVFTKFLSLFFADIGTHLAEITHAREREDLKAIARLAHNLASSAGCVGAAQTSIIARDLEQACRKGDRESCERLLGQLAESAGAAVVALRLWLQARPEEAAREAM